MGAKDIKDGDKHHFDRYGPWIGVGIVGITRWALKRI